MKKLHLSLILLLAFSMLLAACGPQAPAEPVVEEPVVEEPVVEEPVVEEPVEEPIGPASAEDLDIANQAFLDRMKGYNVIKTPEDMLAVLMEDPPPFVLDVRTTAELEEGGYIEGANAHIPLNELAQHIELLPSFDTPIVTYCKSGWRATIAMTALQTMGWENVRAFKKTDFSDWVASGYPVAEGKPENAVLNAANPDPGLVAAVDVALKDIASRGAKFGIITIDDLNLALTEKPDLVVVDVRRQEEVDQLGSIDASKVIHIPLEELIQRRSELPTDLSTPIVIHCKAGHRSTIAMTMLLEYGYEDVLSLKGGYDAWKEAGYATVGGVPTLADTFGTMLTNMKGYNAVKADQLLVEMAEDNPPFILDVRSTEEVTEQGHIEGAFHIPLNELAQHLDVLPGFDTPIVTYCAGGWRATIAMTALHGMGWTNVRALKVPFADWVAAGNPVVAGLPENMVLNAAQPVESLVTPIDAATVAVKDMGTKWGIQTAEGLNLALAEKPDLILMDVRTPEELAEKGVIEVVDQELIALPIENFVTDSAMWPADKDAEIVIYCGSGHRSTMAMTIMLAEGYTNVTSLNGGFGGYVEAGYPVVEYAAP